MSEETKEAKPNPASADGILQILVDLANQHEGPLPLPITLYVGGLIISGRIISRKSYFEDLSAQLRQAFEPYQDIFKDIPQMEAWFKSFGEPDESEKPEDEVDDAEYSERVLATRHIHLANATIHQTGASPIPSEGGLLWRGRLSSIDGFSLGVLKNVPRDEIGPDVWTAV